MSDSELFIAEVPFWRHAVASALTIGEGGAMPWCVRWRAPGEQRSRILQTYDSRYAAEQGLERYRSIRAEGGATGLLDESASSQGLFMGPVARLLRPQRNRN